MATYPLGTKRFTTKRDLLDDVDASHINDIQSEIEATQDTLGANPHQDNTGYDAGWRWNNLRSRLEYMIRGRHLPVYNLYNTTQYTLSTDSPAWMAFAAPSTTNDTHGLFSNSTIRVKRPGYYTVNAGVYFLPTTLRGTRVLQIRKNNTQALRVSSQAVTGTETQPSGIWLSCSWSGYLAKSEYLSLYTDLLTGSVYADGKYSVRYAALDGHMIRDL